MQNYLAQYCRHHQSHPHHTHLKSTIKKKGITIHQGYDCMLQHCALGSYIFHLPWRYANGSSYIFFSVQKFLSFFIFTFKIVIEFILKLMMKHLSKIFHNSVYFFQENWIFDKVEIIYQEQFCIVLLPVMWFNTRSKGNIKILAFAKTMRQKRNL